MTHQSRKLSAQVPNPYGGLSFMRWAQLLSQQWAQYNVPSPVSEGLWHEWAEHVRANPAVVSLGVVDPRGFSDWRAWAAKILQVPN